MNPETAKSWSDVLSTSGGWGVAVVLGVVLGGVIIWLAKRYESYRNETQTLFIQMIKDQTELLTENKIQGDRVIALLAKVDNRLDSRGMQ